MLPLIDDEYDSFNALFEPRIRIGGKDSIELSVLINNETCPAGAEAR